MRFPFRVRVPQEHVNKVARAALREDISRGDITSSLVIPPGLVHRAEARVKAKGVIAGLGVFRAVFKAYDDSTTVRFLCRDGDGVRKGQVLAEVMGRARSILTCERVALNFLQHLSGIATETAAFVRRVRGTGVRIIDTRKTTPMLRLLEKYAVAQGGGYNHRPSLSHLVMIKDNHVEAAGGLEEAVGRARKGLAARGRRLLVEVEVCPGTDLSRLDGLPVDIVMLDNFPVGDLKKAISYLRRLRRRPYVEVSGGVSLDNVRKIAMCGPDFISIGHITHSAPSLDIGLDFGG